MLYSHTIRDSKINLIQCFSILLLLAHIFDGIVLHDIGNI